MSPPTDNEQPVQLCEVCSQLDFESLLPAFQNCSTKTNRYSRRRNRKTDARERAIRLGTYAEIFLRKGRCAICTLISKSYRYRKLDSNRPGHWYILKQDLGISGTVDSEHMHTSVTTIQFEPTKSLSRGINNLAGNLNLQRIFNDPDNSIPQDFGGRLVPAEVDSNLVKKWLHICDTKHSGECARPSTNVHDTRTFVPEFLIDVVDSCLVRATLDCRYVALSYVWGTTKTLKHVLKNSPKLQEPNSLRNMEVPETIRDSMVLVQNIGCRYLWVDALCIIQDDIGRSYSQISNMDKIYAQAYLTIIAASGDNSQAGLPGIHPTTRVQRQVVLRLRHYELVTLLCDGFAGGYSFRDSTWPSRAWTMQEIILSRRCLIFTQDQVYWVCQEFMYMEETALEDATISYMDGLPWYLSIRLPTEPMAHEKYGPFYLDLIQAYRKRQLTHNSDMINAFSGISSALSTSQGDEYIWGHPQSLFSWSLVWTAESETRNFVCTELSHKGQPKKVPFPSWSWAAWEFHFSSGITHYFKSDAADYQSVTHFFITNQEGDLVGIPEEAPTDTCDTRRVGPRGLPWQGNEWGRPEFVLPKEACIGCLHFWASIAPLELRRGESNGSLRVCGVPKLSLFSKRRNNLSRPSIHVTGFQEPGTPTVSDWDKGATDSIVLDFLPVCRFEKNSGIALCLLGIEWKDGVSYRVGAAFVEEEFWIATTNKRWQFVTLG